MSSGVSASPIDPRLVMTAALEQVRARTQVALSVALQESMSLAFVVVGQPHRLIEVAATFAVSMVSKVKRVGLRTYDQNSVYCPPIV